MISDFTLITKHFPENNDIVIVPVGDVHLGAAEHMESAWREFRTYVAETPNVYIVILGDVCNNAIRNSVSNVYDEVIRPREQKRLMVEMLEPLRDKILCAVPGNHEARSSKEVDDDVMYDIMAKLDLEDLYRENIAFLKIQIGNLTSNGTRNPTYTFAITHGSGGGMLTGGAVNRGERFGYSIDGVDALVLGHTHKPFVSHPGKIKVDTNNNKVSVKPFHVITCSSWLFYGNYACRKMLLPSSHIPQKILLSGKAKDIKILLG